MASSQVLERCSAWRTLVVVQALMFTWCYGRENENAVIRRNGVICNCHRSSKTPSQMVPAMLGWMDMDAPLNL
jgi:hypothetical protein